MSYDAWKTRSPEDDGPDQECWHEDYEVNSEGRATCCYCHHAWWQTSEESERERKLSADYDKAMRRAERRERVEAWVHWLAFWRRWRKPEPINDDVPF